jgi:hypothetical protein
MKPRDTKGQWQPKKIKWYNTWLNQLPNIIFWEETQQVDGRFQNNPSIGWVHPKPTHARPLAWTNKKLTCKLINLSI